MWDIVGQVLGVAIALSFVYLLLSLMVSTAVESMLSVWQKLRPKLLRESLQAMFDNLQVPVPPAAAPGPGAPALQPLVDAVLEHPLIRGLSSTAVAPKFRRDVSYISSTSFAATLFDIMLPPDGTPRTFDKIRKQIKALPPSSLRATLFTLADLADDNRDKFLDHIAHWFDETQEHVRAAYRRASGFWLMLIAAILVVILNVDSIRIANVLWQDAKLRDTVAKAAEQYVTEHAAGSTAATKPSAATKPGDKSADQPPSKPGEEAPKQPAETPAQKTAASSNGKPSSCDTDLPLNRYLEVRKKLTDSGLPLGWSRTEFPTLDERPTCPRRIWSGLAFLLIKLAGLAITTLATSLGAPFWFDMVNKLVNIRSSVGNKPPTLAEVKERKAAAASGGPAEQ